MPKNLWVFTYMELPPPQLAPVVHGITPTAGSFVLRPVLIVLPALDLHQERHIVRQPHQEIRFVVVRHAKVLIGDGKAQTIVACVEPHGPV